jgi:two-component system chemotaxis family response regulator WspR
MKIGIVNDSLLAVESIRRILNSVAPQHTVVWVAYNGSEAVQLCARHTPDLVLMDIKMPQMDGVDATRAIMESSPCAILIVTASVTSNAAKVFEAMGAGALDAVATPVIAKDKGLEGKNVLLESIDRIGNLITATDKQKSTSARPLPIYPTKQHEECLIAIGCSTGGPRAIVEILATLPGDFPAAIVVIQHMDAQFTPGLIQWLDSQVEIPVRLAEDGDRPQAGTALFACTDGHLRMTKEGLLQYTDEMLHPFYHPSVDVFFLSVANHWLGNGIGVLLTGMGRDGAEGLLALRQTGWHTITQDKNSSVVYGMPKAAVELNAADEILSLEYIGPACMNLLASSKISSMADQAMASKRSHWPQGQYRITVLLVDDQPMVAEALRRAMADEDDIDFQYCQTPNQAVAKATEISPTVILQDLVMPDIDGLTMVENFRANLQTNRVPIIVLSTKEEPEIKSKAFSLGADDYLVKLPDRIELIARIRHHSKAYIHLKERDEAFRALQESEQRLAQANKALEKLSSLDGLTGIANRRRFDQKLESNWHRAIRQCSPLSLILIDIDFFKLYNDHYGHQKGDDCLRKVARTIEESATRSTDLVTRYGGEEFGVVLPDTGLKGALEIAEQLRINIERLNIEHRYSKSSGCVTISLGVAATIPTRNSHQNSLITAADRGLYLAKKEGRNRVKFSEIIAG